MLSHDVHEKLRTTDKLLEDLQELQSMRMSHRPEGPAGPTPGTAIRPSTQGKSIGKIPFPPPPPPLLPHCLTAVTHTLHAKKAKELIK